jgi:hypothetical protein
VEDNKTWPVGKARHRYEDNIKMSLKGVRLWRIELIEDGGIF